MRLGPLLRRRGWLLLSAIVLVAALSYGLSQLTDRTYTSEAVLLTTSRGDTPDQSTKLAGTYAAVLSEDQQILGAIARRVGADVKSVRRRLSVTNTENTAVLTIRFRGRSRGLARAGTDELVRAVTAAIPSTPNVEPRALTTVSPASLPPAASSTITYLLIGGLLGGFLGVVGVIAAERRDPHVDDRDQLAAEVGCPVTDVRGLSDGAIVALLARLREFVDVHPATVCVMAGTRRGDALATQLANRIRHVGERAPETAGFDVIAAAAPGTMNATNELAALRSDVLLLAVPAGARVSDLRDTVARLSDLGTEPRWALLGSLRRRADAPVAAPRAPRSTTTA